MEELQKRMANKKELLDKERDDAIIGAIRKVNASREQGLKLANLVQDKESFETIMRLEIKGAKKKPRPKNIETVNPDLKESEASDEQ